MNNFFSKFRNTPYNQKPSFLSNEDNDVFDVYAKLESLYSNNGAYNNVARAGYYNNKWVETIKPLRTVVNRSVEFYVSKILSGSHVSTDNVSLLEAVEQINKWSNFNSKKKTYSRNLSLLGDLFIKVNNDENKIWHEEIKSKHVTDFVLDNRGILQEIRIDVPVDDGKTHTEYWTLDGEGYVSIWEHQFGRDAKLENLGNPSEYYSLAELGITFIPIVYIQFRDGSERGNGCVSSALDKIDEANRISTRLHSLLFRYGKPTMAVMANMIDGNGKPLPPPKINTKKSTTTNKTEDVEKEDNDILYLPGFSKAEQLIPNLPYGDALKILQDMMNELEQDLPELKYYSLKGDLSGKAISQLLGGAIDRAKEARENLIQGLIRIIQMCLTIGQFHSIFQTSLGSYDKGSFEFNIECDEIYGMDTQDKALTLKGFVEAGIPLASALRLSGYDEAEIETIMQDKQTEDKTKQDNLVNSLMGDSFNLNK